MTQLALPLRVPETAACVSPVIPTAANAEALSWLERPKLWPGGRLLLVAEAGAGKSLLLAHWAAGQGGVLIAGAALPMLPPDVATLAIDDADRATEESLLHALNAMAERRGLVLMAARRPAADWPIRLPDLASRLRLVPMVEIGRADDALLRDLLAKLLAERQLAVAPPMRDWLLRHLPRSPAAIRAAAAALDRTLQPGSRVTHAVASTVVEQVVAARPGEEA